jgi:hypothetical protein
MTQIGLLLPQRAGEEDRGNGGQGCEARRERASTAMGFPFSLEWAERGRR